MPGEIFARLSSSGRSRRIALVALVALMVTVAGCGSGPSANNSTGDGGVNGTTDAGVATDTETETTTGADNDTTGNATDGNATDGNATDGNATGNETGTANLRVAHMAAGAPAVDVYVNGEEFLTGVEYGDVSDYAEVAPGEYNVTITAAGDSEVVLTENVTVEAANYTVAAIPLVSDDGSAANETATDANASDENMTDVSESLIQLLVLEDGSTDGALDGGNATATTTDASANETTSEKYSAAESDTTTENDTNATGNASVRIVHASPDAGPVNVVVSGTDTVLAENVTFGTATEYVEVPAGDYTLDIVPANDTETVALSVDVTLEADTPYTAFAAGYVSGDQADETPLEAFLTVDDPALLTDDDAAADENGTTTDEETSTPSTSNATTTEGAA